MKVSNQGFFVCFVLFLFGWVLIRSPGWPRACTILLLLPPLFWNCRHGHHAQPCCFVSNVVLGVKSRTFCTLAKHGFFFHVTSLPLVFIWSRVEEPPLLSQAGLEQAAAHHSPTAPGFLEGEPKNDTWISTVYRGPIELPCPVLWGRLSTQTTGSGSLCCPGHHSGDVRQHSTGENHRRHPPQVIHKSALGGGMGEQFH